MIFCQTSGQWLNNLYDTHAYELNEESDESNKNIMKESEDAERMFYLKNIIPSMRRASKRNDKRSKWATGNLKIWG